MLNCIDCSTERSEIPETSKILNHANVGLISAPCPVLEKNPEAESAKVQGKDGKVWSKLTSLLSNRSVMKGNDNSGFSFFL